MTITATPLSTIQACLAAQRSRDEHQAEAGRLLALSCQYFTPAGWPDNFAEWARDHAMEAFAAQLEAYTLRREYHLLSVAS